MASQSKGIFGDYLNLRQNFTHICLFDMYPENLAILVPAPLLYSGAENYFFMLLGQILTIFNANLAS